MGILQQIRTKFGVSDNTPNSIALTQALGDLNSRDNKNRADAAAIEAAIPSAVIASIDGAATERRKLANLDSEHGALVKAADLIRREIDAAVAREEAAELQARWETAVDSAEPVIVAVSEIESVIETLPGRIEKLRDTLGAFEARLPWDPAGLRRAVTDYIGSARLAVDALADSLRQARTIRDHAESAKAGAASAALQVGPQEEEHRNHG
jgi:hypothetical protein